MVSGTMQIGLEIEPMQKAEEKKMVAVVVEPPWAHKESNQEEMMVMNLQLLLVQAVATKSK